MDLAAKLRSQCKAFQRAELNAIPTERIDEPRELREPRRGAHLVCRQPGFERRTQILGDLPQNLVVLQLSKQIQRQPAFVEPAQKFTNLRCVGVVEQRQAIKIGDRAQRRDRKYPEVPLTHYRGLLSRPPVES